MSDLEARLLEELNKVGYGRPISDDVLDRLDIPDKFRDGLRYESRRIVGPLDAPQIAAVFALEVEQYQVLEKIGRL